MDWLDHVLRENSYLCGAIACVVTFVFLRVVRPKPVPTTTRLVAGVVFCMLAAFEVRRSWPPTPVQSETLVGTILACFLFGLMLPRLDSITFDTTAREFVIARSVPGTALTALFAGGFVSLSPLFWDKVGGVGDPIFAAWCAWMAGGALSQWRRVARADEA
jgi:hypothetical protein